MALPKLSDPETDEPGPDAGGGGGGGERPDVAMRQLCDAEEDSCQELST